METRSRSAWLKPPSAPLLPEGAVDVWLADLDAAADGPPALLSPEEVARAARFTHEDARRRWARAHSILRALLGAYLDTDPRPLRFEAGPHGKPHLAGSGSPLRFNLSHSAEVALYAFATERAGRGRHRGSAPANRPDRARSARLGPRGGMPTGRASAGRARARVPPCLDPTRGDAQVPRRGDRNARGRPRGPPGMGVRARCGPPRGRRSGCPRRRAHGASPGMANGYGLPSLRAPHAERATFASLSSSTPFDPPVEPEV